MHQQARHPPRGKSPATPSQTNPTRTNNPRDARDTALGSRSRAASEATLPGASMDTGAGDAASGGTATAAASAASLLTKPSRESIKKLDQIIQNFYLKAAVLIIQSRIPVTLANSNRAKTNKWFQIETDDIEDFRDELKTWKHSGSFENRPPPMIIETYLDASRLTPGQALVVVDENGKRVDALESLNASDLSASGSGSGESISGRSDDNGSGTKIRSRSTEIILERWKVELRCIPNLGKTASDASSDDNSSGKGGAEREMEDFGPTLPTIYKRSIVFFRSLFVTTNVLPAYRFSRQATKKNVHPALQVRSRVLTGAEAESRISANGFDTLRQPLFYDGGRDPVTDYMFGDLEVPIGRFSASVTYRNSCSFSIADSESLLSSRFMGIDENYFRPSLPTAQRPDSSYSPRQQSLSQQQHHRPQPHQQHSQQDSPRRRESPAEVVGSLPHHLRHGHHAAEQSYRPPPQQTYGSLSTFHGPGALGTSPLSALKAVRPAGSESSSPTDSIRPSSRDQQGPQVDPPNSLPITAGGRNISAPYSGFTPSPASSLTARPSGLRNLDGAGRRSSVSFNPFKAGSLSGSPRVSQDEIMQMPSSPLSGSRPMSGISALAHARNRSSLTAGMAASLRGAPSVSTSVGSPSTAAAAAMAIMEPGPGAGSSPRPSVGSRYSSSFTHRRGRSSFGGTSRGEDDQGSSGKQSLASSMVQPGSGLLAELGGVGSSGSYQTDDDNISDFLKALESKKTLRSFESTSRRNESARRTVAQLSRYQLMRESNVALTDSMNSSMQLPSRSLSSSARPLTATASGLSGSLPGAGANVSPSMSPSMSPKPMSPHTPHTPHTPAVPSRLSENAIIDYQGPSHARPRPGRQASNTTEEEGDADEDDEGAEERTIRTGGGGATAIDIPVSPRPLLQDGGSKAAKTRPLVVDDDGSAEMAAFGSRQRSLSATAEDREPLSPGAVFRLEGAESGGSGGTSTSASASAGGGAGILRPASGGAMRRRSNGGGGGDGARTAPSSMPPALSAAATALRSVTASSPAPGASSQRRRYTSRLQRNDSSEAHGSGSERPTTPHMSRGSGSGSFSGRYSGGGSGRSSGVGRGGGGGGGGHDDEAEEDILVFDLSEFGA